MMEHTVKAFDEDITRLRGLIAESRARIAMQDFTRGERLLADTKKVCEAQIAFWHGARKPKPPFGRYLFLLNAVDEGYGGLEHRASTALIAKRRDLPQWLQAAAAAYPEVKAPNAREPNPRPADDS